MFCHGACFRGICMAVSKTGRTLRTQWTKKLRKWQIVWTQTSFWGAGTGGCGFWRAHAPDDAPRQEALEKLSERLHRRVAYELAEFRLEFFCRVCSEQVAPDMV